MTNLTVIEPVDGNLFDKLKCQMANQFCDISISKATPGFDGDTDIAVLSPDCDSAMIYGSKLRCRTLLLPGGISARFADAECVVTYGMGAKDTLTLSSIGKDSCVLSLQRELVTALGDVLDRQELKIHRNGSTDELLAFSGAMLLLGLPSTDLS